MSGGRSDRALDPRHRPITAARRDTHQCPAEVKGGAGDRQRRALLWLQRGTRALAAEGLSPEGAIWAPANASGSRRRILHRGRRLRRARRASSEKHGDLGPAWRTLTLRPQEPRGATVQDHQVHPQGLQLRRQPVQVFKVRAPSLAPLASKADAGPGL